MNPQPIMMLSQTSRPSGRFGFFGWRVVGAAFTIATFAWGVGFYGPPIFLDTLNRTQGWSITLISTAVTTHYLLGAVLVARLAGLHRRFGLVAVTRAGILLSTAGLLGWAFAREPWQLFLATPLSGAGWALTSGAALNAMVAPWFVRRRPAALSVAFNGASIGGVLFSPLWVALIRQLGFPMAALLVAALSLPLLWWLVGCYLGRTPAELGLAPDGDESTSVPAEATVNAAASSFDPWRDRQFITLAAAASLGLFAQVGMVAHLFSLLVPSLGAGGAGGAMGMITIAAVFGRFLLGWMMPPGADRRIFAAGNGLIQIAGSVILVSAGASPGLLLLGSALFGLGLGNLTTMPAIIAQAEFRPADLTHVVALVTAISQAGYAFAPAIFGLLRSTGSSAGLPSEALLPFAAAGLLQIAALILFLIARQPAVKPN